MLQRYVLRQAFWPLIASILVLGVLALLVSSLSSLDLIIDQRQSVLTFLQITLLAFPQVMALIMPLALFLAAAYATNKLQSDSEVVVFSAAGMSRWQIAEPIFKLAVIATVANLAINLWVQPTTYREMRDRLYEVRGDLAARLVRPGQFRSPADGLTIYARDLSPNGRLSELFIEDARDQDANPIVYYAQSGFFQEVNGEPALQMANGSVQSIDANNALTYLEFDSYTFELSTFLDSPGDVFYKLSDRYLHELLFPNVNGLWDWRHREELLAEGHYRLSAPLYNISLVMIALAATMGGGFSRTGYGRRVLIASGAAISLRLVGFAVQAACADEPALNVMQYIVPVAGAAVAFRFIATKPLSPPRRSRREALASGAEPATA